MTQKPPGRPRSTETATRGGIEEKFGAFLKKRREAWGWNQDRVARRLAERGLSLHPSAIARTERATRPITLNEADLLAGFFGSTLVSALRESEGRDIRDEQIVGRYQYDRRLLTSDIRWLSKVFAIIEEGMIMRLIRLQEIDEQLEKRGVSEKKGGEAEAMFLRLEPSSIEHLQKMAAEQLAAMKAKDAERDARVKRKHEEEEEDRAGRAERKKARNV